MIKCFSVVLLLAGASNRCELGYNKVLYLINGKPLFRYSLDEFLKIDNCEKVIIVCKKEEEKEIEKYLPYEFLSKIEIVYGGALRQESVLNGLKKVETDYVLIHDGARPCIKKDDINNVLLNLVNSKTVTLATLSQESMRYVNNDSASVLDRNKVINIKTPQGMLKNDLIFALNEASKDGLIFTDDVSAIEKYFKISPKIVACSNNNIKVTKYEDLKMVESILGKKEIYRIGHSCDTHRLENGNEIIVGAVKIPCEFRIVAHSDGDVLYHSISEAIIGALGMGDLGKWFSDKDPKYKNISSSYFLEKTKEMLIKEGYEIVNIDSTIYVEKPMMAPYIEKMKTNISNCLGILESQINVKATRGEGVGPIGESKAISSETIIMIKTI